jgi:hypothetical protein
LDLLKSRISPVVFLLSTPQAVKEFYNANYQALRRLGTVFAQGYSGGSNKIFRNFSLKSDGILLVTPAFLLRNQARLQPSAIIMEGLPVLELNHPYQQALLAYWQDKFVDFMKLQEGARLFLVLQALYSENLQELVLFLASSDKLAVAELESAFSNLGLGISGR